jgi:hypothetical protein
MTIPSGCLCSFQRSDGAESSHPSWKWYFHTLNEGLQLLMFEVVARLKVLSPALDRSIKTSRTRASTTPQVGHEMCSGSAGAGASFQHPRSRQNKFAELKAEENVDSDCTSH